MCMWPCRARHVADLPLQVLAADLLSLYVCFVRSCAHSPVTDAGHIKTALISRRPPKAGGILACRRTLGCPAWRRAVITRKSKATHKQLHTRTAIGAAAPCERATWSKTATITMTGQHLQPLTCIHSTVAVLKGMAAKRSAM
jgi:hypothetical protein